MKKKVSEDSNQNQLTKLAGAIDRAYSNIPHLLWRSFLSGLFTALGATLGLAVVGTLLGIVFKALGVVPLIGDSLSEIGNSLNNE